MRDDVEWPAPPAGRVTTRRRGSVPGRATSPAAPPPAEEPPLRVAARVMRAAGGALAATVVLPLAPVALLAVTALAAVGHGRVALADGTLVRAAPMDAVPAAAWLAVLAVATLGAIAVAFAASVTVAAGALVGRPVSAGVALRRAVARPWPTLTVVAVLAGEVVAARTVLAAVGTTVNAPLGVVAALLVLVPAVPLTLAAACGVLDGPAPWRALGRVGPLLRDRFVPCGQSLVLVAAAVVGPGLLRPYLPRPAALAGWVELGVAAVLQVAVTVAAAMLLAAVLAVLVLPGEDRAEAGAAAPAPRPALVAPSTVHAAAPATRGTRPRGGRHTARRIAPVLAAALVPVLALSVLLWAEPSLAPAYRVDPLGTGEVEPWSPRFTPALRVWDGGGELLVRSGSTTVPLHRCSPDCAPSEIVATGSFASVGTPPGVLVHARWQGSRLVVSEPCWGVDPAPECLDGAVQLRYDSAPAYHLDNVPTYALADVSPSQAYRLVEAVGHRGALYVVSLAPKYPDWSVLEAQLHRCVDPLCAVAAPEHTILGRLPGVEVEWPAPPRRPVDLAVRPDGSAVVSVHDPRDGSVTVLSCATIACSRVDRHTVVPAHAEPTAATDGDVVAGSRVAVRPDGRPVVAYRDARDGSARLVDCLDVACARTEERVLTGPDVRRGLPGLAVDRAGRPQLAATDPDRGLVLLSCRDSGCGDVRTVPLRAADTRLTEVDVVLDAADRPVVAATGLPAGNAAAVTGAVTAAVLTCERPGCGTEP